MVSGPTQNTRLAVIKPSAIRLSFREGDAVPEEAIRGFVRQARELNAARGDPTRRN
jgi:hypothetical protein